MSTKVIVFDFLKLSHYHYKYLVIISQVSDFFKQHDVRSGKRALQQSLEMIKFNIHWVKINAKNVNDWLIKYCADQNLVS